MKSNYKIAVMLNGHPKHLETTQNLFKHWNKLYDNIQFDFFVSIWDTIDNEYERFEKTLDYNKLDWVTKLETLKEEDCPYDLKNHPAGQHQPHYCYTLKKVNELRNSHNVKYDAVLQTRCDIVILRKTLDGLVSELIGSKIKGTKVTKKNIFTRSGSTIHSFYNNIKNEWIHSLWTQDTFFFGHPYVIDIFSGMFDYIFMENKYNETMLMHCFQAEYLNNHKIYNMDVNEQGAQLLIRESYRFSEYTEGSIQVSTQTIKTKANTNSGWGLNNPTPLQLINLINEKGMDWIYNKDNEDKVLFYFNSTPKK